MSVISFDKPFVGSSHHPWLPLVTQQHRLRNVHQLLAYNLESNESAEYYFTLHLTAMSAPFFTSPICHSINPRWTELKWEDIDTLRISKLVLRVWCGDNVILTWGVNLSGLVYLGTKLSDLRPEFFNSKTVIFAMKGGYFTCKDRPRVDQNTILPFVEHMNVLSTESEMKVFKLIYAKQSASDFKQMYNVKKLQRLQSLQLQIKKSHLAACDLRNKLVSKLTPPVNADEEKSEQSKPESSEHIRYAPQLLTMNSLHKMLQKKPTSAQKNQMTAVQKDIETVRLKIKILTDEKERITGDLRVLKEKLNVICDDNDEKDSQLMENYRKISKDLELFRQWKKSFIRDRENLCNLTKKLQQKRRQLMNELLHLYPIKNFKDKYYINGVELPNSNLLLENSEASLSVALGYCSHILVMCASFLQIPLRYPIRHYGSHSVIEEPIMPDKYREFPLFTRGKDAKQFIKAVYLLNKNIAQYLHDLGFRPEDLKATLPNLLILLQGKEHKYSLNTQNDVGIVQRADLETSDSSTESSLSQRPFRRHSKSSSNDPILDNIREEVLRETYHYQKKSKCDKSADVCQAMAIPEAILNKQISDTTFLSYMKNDTAGLHPVELLEGIIPGECQSVNLLEKSEVTSSSDTDTGNNFKSSTSTKSKDFSTSSANGSTIKSEEKRFASKGSMENVFKVSKENIEQNLQSSKAKDVKSQSLNVRTDALLQKTCFKLVKPRCSSE